jgi:hypothetical protein
VLNRADVIPTHALSDMIEAKVRRKVEAIGT